MRVEHHFHAPPKWIRECLITNVNARAVSLRVICRYDEGVWPLAHD